MRGIKYAASEKVKAVQMVLNNKSLFKTESVFIVSKKFKVSERNLWLWLSKYDGTLESLQSKSSRPLSKHPNEHTTSEVLKIKKVIKLHPNINYAELYGELRANYGYKRSYWGMYRYMRIHNLMPKIDYDKYVPAPYDTPEMLGIKMQMDVKYVPIKCLSGKALSDYKQDGTRLYQYTIIDEATRERFLYCYNEVSGYSTVDFIKRAIVYFGYNPRIIQTDNGREFTNPKTGVIATQKKHAVDLLLDKLKIEHQLIRPYTPRHNGKVERSHRNDQERFYNYEMFNNLTELRQKMQKYLTRSNNIPSQALRNRYGKKVLQTPLQKRQELLDILKDEDRLSEIMFIQRAA